jgi:tetratricopeptide (TPR) repeat protein
VREVVLAVALVGLTVAALHPVLSCGFINFDDQIYVTENHHVQHGLSWDGVAWACRTTYFGNWHPLVWLSFQLDHQLYGLNHPSGFHATNLLVHTGSVVLLFAALRRLTGVLWPSALAAALFAVHPLNVESVAWVAERKGVLCTFFWMLTLWAYARYAERPGLVGYGFVMLGMVLGLMAKPMMVTLPAVLLLLDFWPLRRFRSDAGSTPASLARLLGEKVPLLVIAAGFSVVAVIAQGSADALPSLERFPLAVRLENAVVSYVWYLNRTVFPHGLAPFYPYHGGHFPAWLLAGAVLLLLGITLLALRMARPFPPLAVGWLWYVGTLVPVLGLVQVGVHARADRYAYIPLIGLFILAAWSAAAVARRGRVLRAGIVGLAVLALAGLAVTSWVQARHWRDSVTLWTHALQVTEANVVAENCLGCGLIDRGQDEAALPHCQAALRFDPHCAQAHHNVGTIFMHQGRNADALLHLQEAAQILPSAGTLNNLGLVLLGLGRLDEAVVRLREAVRLDPEDVLCRQNLARTLLRDGQEAEAVASLEEGLRRNPAAASLHGELGLAYLVAGDWPRAESCYRSALALEPGIAEYHGGLALALTHQGRTEEGRAEYEAALRLEPGWPQSRLKTAWELATHADAGHRAGRLAVPLAEQAAQAVEQPGPAEFDALAAAYAEAGRFPEAVANAQKAVALAAAAGPPERVPPIEYRLLMYRARRAFHLRSGNR